MTLGKDNDDTRPVVMLGDSLTAAGRWGAAFPRWKVRNMGVNGDGCAGVWARLGEVAKLRPRLVFLQIGINDFLRGATAAEVVGWHGKIWRALAEGAPGARLVVLSLLPYVENALPYLPPDLDIMDLNAALKAKAGEGGLAFVDLFPLMADADRQLRLDYTTDGLHLNEAAYKVWAAAIEPFLEGQGPADGRAAEGADVLRSEARALLALADGLDGSFGRAVDILLHLNGRVAVTGMGKSGHVARKVAATLSSTGSPAYFIHPAEAMHGDLGMMGAGDGLLAYSNSGETAELAGILAFCGRRHLPVIGVTKNAHSFLGRESTVRLILPDIPEACPIGCAPTTSTTMMMALGDALALCLLRARGFTAEDFKQYHPGGNLGVKLLAAKDIMHTGDEIPLVRPELPMPDVLFTITGKSFGSTGVVGEDGRLIGIITDGDLRRHMGPGFLGKTAGDIMTRNPVTITAGTLAHKALGLMQRRAITAVFVVDGQGVPQGILHIHDCLRAGLS